MKIKSLVIFLSVFTSLGAMAQGNFAPYSQMGIGDLEDGYYNRTSGMGNTGLAYRNNRFLISNNPASYSGLSDQFFTVEMGIRGSLINYYGTPVDVSNKQSGDITFRRLAMGMKLSKHWGSSIGLVPFSTQNYEYDVPYYLQGSTSELANLHYAGHGGVNKAYWGNSYEFFHHVSVGVEAGYLFGQLNQKATIQNFGTGTTLASTTNTVDLNNLYMQYGLQVYGRIGKRWEYSLGGTFNPRNDLLASYNQVVLDNDSIQRNNPNNKPDSYLSVPNAFGVGLSITHNQKYTFVADFKHQAWAAEKNSYPGKNYAISDANRGSVGFEISKKKSFYNSKVELSYFQAGAYYGETYLQINGQQIKDYGVTASFGINGLKTPLSYNVVFQYGIKGTQTNNLVEQRYFNLTFVVNYGAIWFTRGKKYD
ncbi:MAG TPA: hypothetical protein VHC48_06410 [Puia sp.]|nr:hypothetical protein [Puia sp.]